MSVDKRQHPRFSVSSLPELICKVRLIHEPRSVQVALATISSGGCGFFGPKGRYPAKADFISCAFSWADKTLQSKEVKGQIIYADSSSAPPGQTFYGVQFHSDLANRSASFYELIAKIEERLKALEALKQNPTKKK